MPATWSLDAVEDIVQAALDHPGAACPIHVAIGGILYAVHEPTPRTLVAFLVAAHFALALRRPILTVTYADGGMFLQVDSGNPPRPRTVPVTPLHVQIEGSVLAPSIWIEATAHAPRRRIDL